MYDVNDYGRMMADPVRMRAYTEALRRAVKPGSVVVDVGTGLGVFAMLAAKFGARKVYAIDTNPCIRLAREVAKRNGYGDRIEFLEKSVFDIHLPEKADVVIADCRGAFTIYARNLDIMMHARSFLRDGGTLLPGRDDLFVSVVQWKGVREEMEKRWTTAGLDWTVGRAEAMSTRIRAPNVELAGADTLVAGARWATIDFTSLRSADARGRVVGRTTHTGEAHFLAIWFESTVLDDITFATTPPGTPDQVYTPLLLPIDPPLAVHTGDNVAVSINALHTKDAYVYAWEIAAPGGTRRQMSDAGAVRTRP